jgi:hypothetical protein
MRIPATCRAGYEVKAAALRSYIVQIERLGALAAIKERVSPETRSAIEAPPLSGVWIDAILVEDMIGALQSLHGMEAVRTVIRAGQSAGVARLLMPIVGGMLRLFGTRPDTLLTRFPDLVKTVIRGVDYDWVPEQPNSGYLKVTFRRKNVPRHVFVGMESGCAMILDLCSTRGSVANTEIINEGTTGIIRVSW